MAAGEKPVMELGPWNPGIESTLPRIYLPLSTLFRPENTTTSVASALELADFSGLPREELTALRPERLALHELLVRVTADLSVPDGNKYEDLGINFRSITRTIQAKDIEPHMAQLQAAYAAMRDQAAAALDAELTRTLFAPPTAAAQPVSRGVFGWLKGNAAASQSKTPPESVEARDHRLLEDWKRRSTAADDALTAAVFASLARVAAAIYQRHGRLIGSKQLIETLCLTLVGNGYGSELIGRMIDPYVAQAVAREGYRRLPPQDHPVVMNVKGASASGKSTMRPLHRNLARALGAKWDEFALISPDIWRKYLLDYDALGEAHRYAGTLTGHEVAIIDKKLDRYMAQKGERGQMSHLLIDRFRFDSFSSDAEQEDGSRLLTRFGHIVYMHFMITPPEATVERAWKRGQQFGRYKAVDDLLDHNVEAYNGMPRLFFTWAMRKDKQVHYEFLDNSVAEGEVPRTVAFGWNGEMNILDVRSFINVDRYAKLNVAAKTAGDVYAPARATDPERPPPFLYQCARTLPVVNFADFSTGRIYARLENGKLAWVDADALNASLDDPEVRAGLLAVAPAITQAMQTPAPSAQRYLDRTGARTLGVWGDRFNPGS
jgi:hypothetical protein